MAHELESVDVSSVGVLDVLGPLLDSRTDRPDSIPGVQRGLDYLVEHKLSDIPLDGVQCGRVYGLITFDNVVFQFRYLPPVGERSVFKMNR